MRNAFLLLFLFLTLQAWPQWVPELLQTSSALPAKDNGKFALELEAIGFFKNNEYFSPVSKGQTFPGTFIRPRAIAQIDDKLRLELGITGLYFSGDQQKNGVEAVNSIFARIQYAIKPNLHLVFGNYYGGANHRLLEPLYRWERQYIEKPESGLQLLYENKRVFADVWLNWQRYIEHGDSVPEILNFGLSAAAKLTADDRPLSISVPLQLTIYHQGGQVDTSNEKMIVCMNAATGLSMEWALGRTVRSIGLDAYVLGYYDKLPNKEIRPYDRGWAVYPVFKVNAKYFKYMLGYWHARKFYTFEGEPLFSSFNPLYPDEELQPTRRLITSKITFFKPLHKAFSLGAQAEGYYDVGLGKFDYSFGVSIRVDAQLFSKKL